MKSLYKIGLVGLGSIGLRHLYNIVSVLDERGSAYTIDLIRSGKGREIDGEAIKLVNQVYDFNGFIPTDYDVIFITNPTHMHFETIKYFVAKTRHMFIEKPVFDNPDISLETLQLKKEGVYYVACPLRYTNIVQYLKHQLDLNQVFSVRAICSSYLPEWRPDQDYRNSYSAYIERGGGVSIDLIHEWDYLCYLFGLPERAINIKGKFSNLEIESDDLSIYIAEYPSMTLEIHLDYFGRRNIREVQLFMADDTVIGDLVNSEVRFLKREKVISFKEQRNDYHRKEIRNFFDILEKRSVNDNDILTALTTLKIAKEGKAK